MYIAYPVLQTDSQSFVVPTLFVLGFNFNNPLK